jgi:8-oxo-dGTP diphosphatase
MRDRPAPAARGSAVAGAPAVDLVVITPRSRQLAILVTRGTARTARAGERDVLPWSMPRGGDTLLETARRLARAHVGADPGWLEQLGAFGDGVRHPSGAAFSVCFVAVVSSATGDRVPAPGRWLERGAVAGLPERQRGEVAAALEAIRWRMDFLPIAFRLLPSVFTLSDLQQVYELLLGRRLHKASFRRALHASWLVEPTDEWRREGRGRPAQLFRFAPRRRRGRRRGLRFDLL